MKLTDILSEIKIKPAITLPSPEEVWKLYFTRKGYRNFMPDEFLGYSIHDRKVLGVRGIDNSKQTVTYYFRVSLPTTNPWLKALHISMDRDTGDYSYWGDNNHDINDPLWQDIIRNLKK